MFPDASKYEYYCLIHGTFMHGWVIVHPRPTAAMVYHVVAGPNSKGATEADVFWPEKLKVHVGSTVIWSSFFHTVTFGTTAQINGLRHKFVLKSTVNGKPLYQINPKDAFPSNPTCGATTNPCMYGGGFMNAGLLQGTRKGPATFAVTFTTPGRYNYGCLVHPGMDGVIKVVG